jgi:hypothetical protein
MSLVLSYNTERLFGKQKNLSSDGNLILDFTKIQAYILVSGFFVMKGDLKHFSVARQQLRKVMLIQ